jgi:hypothetical protein
VRLFHESSVDGCRRERFHEGGTHEEADAPHCQPQRFGHGQAIETLNWSEAKQRDDQQDQSEIHSGGDIARTGPQGQTVQVIGEVICELRFAGYKWRLFLKSARAATNYSRTKRSVFER